MLLLIKNQSLPELAAVADEMHQISSELTAFYATTIAGETFEKRFYVSDCSMKIRSLVDLGSLHRPLADAYSDILTKFIKSRPI